MLINKKARTVDKRIKKPEWLPNWKDISQYPPVSSDNRVWAWEFLRRNPRYQELWNILIKPYVDKEGRVDKRTASEILNNKSLLEAANLSLLTTYQFEDVNDLFKKVFLANPISPDIVPETTLGYFAIFCPTGAVSLNLNFLANNAIGRRPHNYEVAFKFDLRFPIQDQVNMVGSILKEKQKSLKLTPGKRLRNKDYIECLRVLDAYASGETAGSIGKILFPTKRDKAGEHGPSQMVKDIKNRAVRFRDKDYIFIHAAHFDGKLGDKGPP